MAYTIAFYLISALTIAGAAFMLFSRNLLHSAFSLLVVLLGIAGLYALLEAEFLAVVQIMVYVGGIMVLLMFGVLLTNTHFEKQSPGLSNTILALAISLLLAAVLCVAIYQAPAFGINSLAENAHIEQLKEIGLLTLTTYVLPFELAALLLLVALVAAAIIATTSLSNKKQVSDEA